MLSLLELASLHGNSSDINIQVLVCQEIFVAKLDNMKLTSKVLIKGGVALYQLTEGRRGFTQDIDIDMISYSIQDGKIKEFFNELNKAKVFQNISLEIYGPIKELHHPSYKGKSVTVRFTDDFSNIFSVSFDIGVHNPEHSGKPVSLNFIIGISKGQKIEILIDPPEQMLSEKLQSLKSPNFAIKRIKDIFDCYYLINEQQINLIEFVNCFRNISMYRSKFSNIVIAISTMRETLTSIRFISAIKQPRSKWKNVDAEKVIPTINDFLIKINKQKPN